MLPRLHLVIGLLALVIFLFTGQLMQHLYLVPGMENTARAIYRSGHLYIFYAAVINIVIGLYYRPQGRIHILAWFNSALILVSPVLLIAGFFTETKLAQIERSSAYFGAVFIFIALVNILLGRCWLWFKQR